jgi:protein-disulfide isomerase
MTEPEPGKRTRPWRTAFDIGSTVVMIVLAVGILWQGRFRSPARRGAQSPAPIPAEAISIAGAALRGVPSAPVAIIEYADFECSFCARFAQEIEPVLRRQYVDKGRVMFVFKNFPLPMHQQAAPAAEAAWCANRQGKYWEMHDRFFGVSSKLQESDLRSAAKEIGLDPALFESCRAKDEANQQIQAEKAEGERLKVSGTPAFFFGRATPDRRVHVSDVLMGAKSLEAFTEILDRLLNGSRPSIVR